MGPEHILPFLLALFLAVNMGASGTAPAFSAAYGADFLRREAVPGLFGVFVLAGAFLAGGKVTANLGGAILPAELMQPGLVAVLLGSMAVSLFAANLLGVPQSASQSTVLSLLGAGLALHRFQDLHFLRNMFITWLAMPVAAFVLTYLAARFLQAPAGRVFPKTPTAGLRWAVVAAGCYVAFSLGSNNVANAAGPLAAMLDGAISGGFGRAAVVAMALTAPCFAIGSSILGPKVLETSGKEIIALGPRAAVLVSTVTATLLLTASLFGGIPTSLVQMSACSIVAIGVVRHGTKEMLSHAVVRRIGVVWLVAPCVSFACAWTLTRLGLLWGFVAAP